MNLKASLGLALLASYPVCSQELIVAAAADISPLQSELERVIRRETGLTPKFSFGSSGMLARQVRNGAPFDLYLSANELFVQELARDGHILGDSVTLYAEGRLGLWSNSRKLSSLQDLAASDIRAIAIPNPAHAPYGVAAEQALASAGVLAGVRLRLVLAENVRQAFEFAKTGNVDAVITSWTLLRDKGGVLVPDTLHRPLRQAAGVVKGSARPREARAVLAWLVSPEGQALLQRYGLFPPRAGNAAR
jgi:molybdate transport system substrate-binding protein